MNLPVSEPVSFLQVDSYFQNYGYFDFVAEHATKTIFCWQYFSSNPFYLNHEGPQIQRSVETGYFSLLDYTSIHWTNHAGYALKNISALSTNLLKDFCEAVKGLADLFPSIDPTLRKEIDCLYDEESFDCQDERRPEARNPKVLENITAIRSITEAIDTMALSHIEQKAFFSLNGRIRLKCHKMSCQKYATGFLTHRDRDIHLKEHERSFKCSYSHCPRSIIGFADLPAVDDHVKRSHSQDDTASDPKAMFNKASMSEFEQASALRKAISEGSLEKVVAYVKMGFPLNGVQIPHKFLNGVIPISLRS